MAANATELPATVGDALAGSRRALRARIENAPHSRGRRPKPWAARCGRPQGSPLRGSSPSSTKELSYTLFTVDSRVSGASSPSVVTFVPHGTRRDSYIFPRESPRAESYSPRPYSRSRRSFLPWFRMRVRITLTVAASWPNPDCPSCHTGRLDYVSGLRRPRYRARIPSAPGPIGLGLTGADLCGRRDGPPTAVRARVLGSFGTWLDGLRSPSCV